MNIDSQLASINPKPKAGINNAWHANIKQVREMRVIEWFGLGCIEPVGRGNPSLKGRDCIRLWTQIGLRPEVFNCATHQLWGLIADWRTIISFHFLGPSI